MLELSLSIYIRRVVKFLYLFYLINIGKRIEI